MIKLREKKLIIGTLMLTLFGFVGKVLGAVFKIGLTSIVGSYGMGLYQLLFPVLVFFIVFSSEGFATALTVKQAEESGKGRAYFRLAIIGSVSASILSFIIIILVCTLLSEFQEIEVDGKLYLIVGFGVLVISLLSINKARLRGGERFVAYSLFETLEDVLKVLFALILAWLLKPYGINGSVAGVFLGIVLSAFVTLVAICFYKPKTFEMKKIKLESLEKRKFFKYSALSMLAIIVIPAVQFIESSIVVGLLTSANISTIDATRLYGISRGSVSAIINLPFFLITSIEVLLLPNLSRSKNNGIYYKKTQICLFTAVALSLPFVLGFSIFSQEIVNILYGRSLTIDELYVASNLLKIGATGILFASLTSFLVVILNSNSKTLFPFLANLIGGIVKIVFIVFMIPRVSIYAVEFASVLFAMMSCLINLIFAIKYQLIQKPKFIIFVAIFWIIIFVFLKYVYDMFSMTFASPLLSLVFAVSIVGLILVVGFLLVWVILRRKGISIKIKG